MDAIAPPRQAGTPGTADHGNRPHAAPAGGPTAPGMHTRHVRRGAHHTGHISHPRPFTHPRPSTHPGPSTRPGSSAHVGPTPDEHPPGGRPDGALGNRSLADSGSSRHGDLHAVTPGVRAPLTLVPGLVARTGAAEGRGSHHDIPLFPG
ncbi:hypothetical protein ACGF8D_01975 [Streptomyces massasporeus]|uniref:hypothetical protein n=1 Tax=Streptomyces massasporeus TaxID=67324 RepID=UPI003712C290